MINKKPKRDRDKKKLSEQALFQRFYDIAYEAAGIKLKPGKEELIRARLNKRIAALKLNNLRDYLDYLESDRTGQEAVQFLNSISTNYTFFFREPEHLAFLENYVMLAVKKGRRRLRFWSAASSSGEEPYSMAITIQETLEKIGFADAIDYKILATDIDTKTLAKARAGIYKKEAIATMPPGIRAKYFVQQRGEKNHVMFAVKPSLKRRVVFKQFNLSKVPYPMPGPLDVVFCRNVMIYFDDKIRKALVNEVERMLAPQGVFITGRTESVVNLITSLKVLEPSIYIQRKVLE